MKHSIHTEIIIDAPLNAVWAALVNFPEYSNWNPFITYAEGQAAEGSVLNIRIKRQGKKEQGYKVTILEVKENKKFRWLGHFLVPGLCDGDHSFELEALGEDKTRVLHYEHFSGLFVPWVLKNFDANFIALNNALKKHLEKNR